MHREETRPTLRRSAGQASARVWAQLDVSPAVSPESFQKEDIGLRADGVRTPFSSIRQREDGRSCSGPARSFINFHLENSINFLGSRFHHL